MISEKEKYEKLISATRVFEYDKETEPSAYKRESLKLVENLYRYLMNINKDKYEPYGYEITETARRCIGSFDPEKGDFIHYFNSAWKKEYRHIVGDKICDDKYHGLKISEDDRRAVRKFIRLAEHMNTVLSADEIYVKIAEAMDTSVERVKQIAQLNNVIVDNGSTYNENGEEINVWNFISDDSCFTNIIELSQTVEQMLFDIDRVYCSLQERQKPIISDMMTIKIAAIISDYDYSKYSFTSIPVIKRIKDTGTVPTQREIADKYGRDEASISRTIKEFVKKYRKEGYNNGVK